MKRSYLLSAAVALGLLVLVVGGATPRLPDTTPGGASDRSFPLQAVARSSDSQDGDVLGQSVAVSGNEAVVGASGESGGPGNPKPLAGAAYIFGRDQDGPSRWGQVQKLMASDAQSGDRFGVSVGISGEFAAVGAPYENGGAGDPVTGAGAVYVFRRDQGGAGNWGQVEKLTAPDAELGDEFGYAVAIHGDTVIVGAHYEDGGAGSTLTDAGTAYVFQNVSGFGWIYVKTIRPGNLEAADRFGESVAISGDLVVVGADLEDGGSGGPRPQAGAAYIFQRHLGGANEWGEVEKLVATDTETLDYFGCSVAISGDVVVVGAYGEDGGPGDPTTDAGAAYVFANLGGFGWTQIRKLTASDAEGYDAFGMSVAISTGVILVGAEFEDGGPASPLFDSGAAYVFIQHLGGSNVWGSGGKLVASDAEPVDTFGNSVALSGRNAVVGAVREDGGLGSLLFEAGAAYVFSVSFLGAFRAN